jgi:hypothetical protein
LDFSVKVEDIFWLVTAGTDSIVMPAPSPVIENKHLWKKRFFKSVKNDLLSRYRVQPKNRGSKNLTTMYGSSLQLWLHHYIKFVKHVIIHKIFFSMAMHI